MMNFTKIAMKNLNSHPATLMYPIKPRKFYTRTRGHIEINIHDCIFCGMCSRKCPTGAITVSRPDKSWQIDRLRCIQCNSCVENCPKKCLSMGNKYTAPSEVKTKDIFKDA